MYQFKRIFLMDLKNLMLNPVWAAFMTAFPFLLILVFGFLAKGSYGTQVTSYDFYGVTFMIYGALNAATLAANSFVEKDIKSPNMRLIYAPVSGFTIHFSKTLATTVASTVYYTAVAFVLHLITGVNYGGSRTVFVWIMMVMLIFFSASLSVMLCCFLKTEEAVNQIVSFLITLLSVLGGLFFPVSGLGKAIAVISRVCPVTWVSETVFQIIYDRNMGMLLPVGIGLMLLSAVFIFISNKSFKTEEFI